MSYAFYTVSHLLGVMLLFLAVGALILHARSGGDEAGRKLAGATHGAALLLILATGFGLIVHLTRLQVIAGFPWPLWVWLKLLIWLVFGGVLVAIRKTPARAAAFWWGLALLGLAAAVLCVYTPWG